jgi:hypothetical protein
VKRSEKDRQTETERERETVTLEVPGESGCPWVWEFGDFLQHCVPHKTGRNLQDLCSVVWKNSWKTAKLSFKEMLYLLIKCVYMRGH